MVISHVAGTVTLVRMCETSSVTRWARSDSERRCACAPHLFIGGRFVEEKRGGPPNLLSVSHSSCPKPAPEGSSHRAELHQRCSDKLARMSRRRSLHGQDIEDTMQKAFGAILESMDGYNPAMGPFDNCALRVGQRTVPHHAAALPKRPDQPEAVDAAGGRCGGRAVTLPGPHPRARSGLLLVAARACAAGLDVHRASDDLAAPARREAHERRAGG